MYQAIPGSTIVICDVKAQETKQKFQKYVPLIPQL
jgi:hypothetical protein